MNSTADIIEQCRYLPGVTVHESGAFTDILLASAEGSGKMRFFRPVFGITPALVSVAAPSWPAPQVEMAKQIEAVVSKDLARQHTAREFAERFSVSESSVKNYFRGVYGQSILQYAAHCRMQHAAELLASTTLSVIEIAGRVGYGNQSKFSAAFRKKFGLSPREYRRAHKLTEKQRSQPWDRCFSMQTLCFCRMRGVLLIEQFNKHKFKLHGRLKKQ